LKTLKKIGIYSIVLIAVIALGLYFFVQSLKPTYDGNLELNNLEDEVQVYYDSYGIPHIYAENEEDAFRSLGYVHAQDRLWQMELLRRIGTGRLSEIFGADMLTTDKFLLSLGIDEASKKTVASLNKDSETVKLTQAYLDGVNQFMENGPTPVEFYLTGVEKKPFVLEDVYNTIGYMAFSFAMGHKTDPLLSEIKNTLGDAYLIDLEVGADITLTTIKNHPFEQSDLKYGVSQLAFSSLEKLPVPLFEGSNSWVISPEKTKNGQVIFANDPHIGFSQPSVWYEAHISTPTYEKYGYHLAGVPFPLLGHNRNAAYGLTMFENDDINFYEEKTNPQDSTLYQYKNEWKKYEIVTKNIKVKDAENVKFTYKKTIHGSVLNGIADQIKGDNPIAMSWVYTANENRTLHAFNDLIHADNIIDFKNSLKGIHAPGLNIMYGDADGNVGWFATAKIFQMPDSINTKFILNGSSGENEIIKYLNFSNNPNSVNPLSNYVYSANNQPEAVNGKIYPGYYLPENRAKRITQLLDAKNEWSSSDVQIMITDVTSAVDTTIARNLIKEIDVSQLSENQQNLITQLKNWKGDATIESVESTIFHRWIYIFLKNTFRDELNKEQFSALMGTHFLKRTIAPMAEKQESIWWDDVTTPEKETKSVIVNKSFQQAYDDLVTTFGSDIQDWTWNKVHTLEHEHPIGKVEALRTFFNVGPFPVYGAREVINNLSFAYTEDGFYKVSSGPSTRRVIDFSDVENSMSIIPTGQSGNPFSKHYEDQAEMYTHGKFRKMLLNKSEIINTKESLLILNAE
jgi:penicillin amidase